MKAYSMDLRKRVLKDCDAGLQTRAVAAKYDVSESWVRRLKQRRREDGRVEPRSPRNKRTRKLAAHAPQLRSWIAAKPDLTLSELRARLKDELQVVVALGTLWNAIAQLGLTVKKKFSGRPNRTART
jgi:transposase